MLYMLDTDMVSYIIKSRSPVAEAKLRAMAPSMVCVSAVTRAELMCGLKRLPADHPIQIVVRRFLKIVKALSWDSDAADYYADMRHQLATTGQPICEMDMMIAAHSLSAGATLVTHNTRHYERIQAPFILANWSA